MTPQQSSLSPHPSPLTGHALRVQQTNDFARTSLDRVRRHPLAMDPATVRRLLASLSAPAEKRGQVPAGQQAGTGCDESLGIRRHCALVVPFAPPSVEEVAREYLALAPDQRPPGTINRLAQERGHNFHQLLRAIGELQLCHGFAKQEPRTNTGPAAAGNGEKFG